MVKNIKNYLRKRVGEYVVNEDGMGVVEVVLIIIGILTTYYGVSIKCIT